MEIVNEGGGVSNEVDSGVEEGPWVLHLFGSRGGKIYLVVKKLKSESGTFELAIERVDDTMIPPCTGAF
eukprot:snap_masked-scaffold_3-processed-gene-17.11-mRNA-1 protein AED:1.00 eAED:1.00 QI:0/0/0/0/1/1/2/0/68